MKQTHLFLLLNLIKIILKFVRKCSKMNGNGLMATLKQQRFINTRSAGN